MNSKPEKQAFMVRYQTIIEKERKIMAVNTEDAIEKLQDVMGENAFNVHVWRLDDETKERLNGNV